MKILAVMAASFFAVLAGPAPAATVVLSTATLPSAQGWTYTATGPTHGDDVESAIWSTNGTTTITMNTMGQGLVSPSSNMYIMSGIVTGTYPITLNWTSRVTASEGVAAGGYGFSVDFNTGGEGIIVGFSTSHLTVGTATPVAFDATAFHDYRIEFTPGSSTFSFYIDNAFHSNGNVLATGTSRLAFGDGTGGANTTAQITALTFTQVPEPSVSALLMFGAWGLIMRRCRWWGEGGLVVPVPRAYDRWKGGYDPYDTGKSEKRARLVYGDQCDPAARVVGAVSLRA